MTYGSLDILIMKFQNSVKAVQIVVSTFYELARAEALKINRTQVKIRVLLDGQNPELGRKQYWEVITAGKNGKFLRQVELRSNLELTFICTEQDLLDEFRYLLPENSKLLGLPVLIVAMGELIPVYPEEEDEDEEDEEEQDSETLATQGRPFAGEWEHDVVACKY